MSKIARHCPKCKRFMPYDWNKPQCKFCGSRVKLDVLGGTSMWDGQADLSGWRKKKFKPARKITGREGEELQVVTVPETPVTNLSSFSPFVLFLCALLTLGVSSTIWIFRRLILINESVRDEECARVSGFYVWIFSHLAAIGMFAWTLWRYAAAFLGGGAGHPQASWQFALALLYAALTFLMSRYYLFWIRDAITEEAMKNAKDAANRQRNQTTWESRKNRTTQQTAEADESSLFANAPLLLWYFGVAYLQLHVQRAFKRGLLTRASFRIEEPEKKEEEKTPDDTNTNPL